MHQVSQETTYFKWENKYGEGSIGRSTNNFASFFTKFLTKKRKTVVYSISTIAPKVAFHYGLPFYSKALDKEGIKTMITEKIDDDQFLVRYIPAHIIPKSLDFLKEWEYGSRFNFVERYLI